MRSTFFSVLISLPLAILAIPHPFHPRRDHGTNNNGRSVANSAENLGINLLEVNALVIKQFSEQIISPLPDSSTKTAIINTLAPQQALLDNLAQIPESLDCEVDLSFFSTDNPNIAVLDLAYIEILLNLGAQEVLRNQSTPLDPNAVQNITEIVSSTLTVLAGDLNSTSSLNITLLDYAILIQQFNPTCGIMLDLPSILPVPSRTVASNLPSVAVLNQSIGQSVALSFCDPKSPTCFCQFVNGDEPEAEVFSITDAADGANPCTFHHLGANLIYWTADSTPLSRDPETRANQEIKIFSGPLLFSVTLHPDPALTT